jgi:chorismate mutase
LFVSNEPYHYARAIVDSGTSFSKHGAPEEQMNRERTLDEVRSEIDGIDETIHDLLIRRTQLVEDVRSIKRNWRVKIQPSREAEILYRLVERHRGPFPKRDLVAMWRILICATLSFEGPFSVAVYAPAEDGGYWDLARDHFGPCTPMARHGSVRAVIETVHRQDAIVGVLPFPRHDEHDPWWRHIVTSNPEAPKIIARLPFAGLGTGRGNLVEGLVVCPVMVTPTGRDRSFLAAETERGVGLAQLGMALQEAGLVPTFATAWRDEGPPPACLCLIEVDGWLGGDDGRLQRLQGRLGRSLHRLILLGGYAVPIAADALGPSPVATHPFAALRQSKGEDAAAS